MHLSLDSLSRSAPSQKPVRRIPAWLIPAAIIVGFAILFLMLFRDRLLPALDVEVALVLATLSDSPTGFTPAENPANRAMLFQASGWIEPDPLPIKATSLIDGVIETVHVHVGQEVKKGQPLATLISEDVRLVLATTEQNHQTLLATRDAHLAAITSARKKLEGTQAMAKAATALCDEAADRMTRFEHLSARAIPQQEIVSARLQFARAEAQFLVASANTAEAEAEIERLNLETRVRENDIRTAAIEIEKAQLALARTAILAPIDGRILRLLAAPGQKKMLQDNDVESSTIAILYQPGELQVRVDVPLADAAGLQIGQAARIRCSLLPDRIFTGQVTRITGEADVQRNTLQAKVRISDPVDQLRPEMLCRVEFLPMPHNNSNTTTTSIATWIPQAAAKEGKVWVCDPETKRLSEREIKATTEIRDSHLRIAEGLRPGEWVVLSPGKFSERQRVNPTLKKP